MGIKVKDMTDVTNHFQSLWIVYGAKLLYYILEVVLRYCITFIYLIFILFLRKYDDFLMIIRSGKLERILMTKNLFWILYTMNKTE